MSITIQNLESIRVQPKDFKDGHAYIDSNGSVFIGNKFWSSDSTSKVAAAAFSACGHVIVLTSDKGWYTEVSLNIQVLPLKGEKS